MSALLTAELGGDDQWAGFWSADAYFLRRTRADGTVEWFSVTDDNEAGDVELKSVDRRGRGTGTRVLEFPLRRMQTRVVIAKGPDGRGMLVGSARRTNRSSVRRTGE